MPEQEQTIDEEQKKKNLKEKLKMLRLNSLQQNRTTLKALQSRHRYRFTRGGKTKRS